jgi:hypothetical protein
MPEQAVGLRIPLMREGAQAGAFTALWLPYAPDRALGRLFLSGSLHGVAACGSSLRP